ncbi:hypothetical protein STEG23_031473 [Scotinomys teguina]
MSLSIFGIRAMLASKDDEDLVPLLPLEELGDHYSHLFTWPSQLETISVIENQVKPDNKSPASGLVLDGELDGNEKGMTLWDPTAPTVGRPELFL